MTAQGPKKYPLLVAILPQTLKIDLYCKDPGNSDDLQEEENEWVSDKVISLLEQAATKDFDVEEIDGGLETLSVKNEAEMIVAMIYIGTCFTFKRSIDLNFDLRKEHDKALDLMI